MHNKSRYKNQLFKRATSARLPFGRVYAAPQSCCISWINKKTFLKNTTNLKKRLSAFPANKTTYQCRFSIYHFLKI